VSESGGTDELSSGGNEANFDSSTAGSEEQEDATPLVQDGEEIAEAPFLSPPRHSENRTDLSFASPSTSVGSARSTRSRNVARTNSRGIDQGLQEELARDFEAAGGLFVVCALKHGIRNILDEKPLIYGESESTPLRKSLRNKITYWRGLPVVEYVALLQDGLKVLPARDTRQRAAAEQAASQGYQPQEPPTSPPPIIAVPKASKQTKASSTKKNLPRAHLKPPLITEIRSRMMSPGRISEAVPPMMELAQPAVARAAGVDFVGKLHPACIFCCNVDFISESFVLSSLCPREQG